MSSRIDALIERCAKRFGLLYDMYPHVILGCSGGKDSTVMIEIAALYCAREGLPPPRVEFFDEEIISDHTIEYMARLRERTDIDLHWYCVPIKCNNAWSRAKPFWYPWEPGVEWSREMPEWALQTHPVLGAMREVGKRRSLIDITLYQNSHYGYERSVSCLGLRADESPARRTRALNNVNNSEQASAWRPRAKEGRMKYSAKAFPIIDWTLEEVWGAIRERGWDWNRSYLRMWQAGRTMRDSRIGPLFGEEPSSTLYTVSEWSPELWERALARVDGADALARYANSALVGRGRVQEGTSANAEMLKRALDDLPDTKRGTTRMGMRAVVSRAFKEGTVPHPNHLMKIAVRGDSRGGRKRAALTLRMMDMAASRPRIVTTSGLQGIVRRHQKEARKKRLRQERSNASD